MITAKLLLAVAALAAIVSAVLAFLPTTAGGIDCGGLVTGRWSAPATCADHRSDLSVWLTISASVLAASAVAGFFTYNAADWNRTTRSA